MKTICFLRFSCCVTLLKSSIKKHCKYILSWFPLLSNFYHCGQKIYWALYTLIKLGDDALNLFKGWCKRNVVERV